MQPSQIIIIAILGVMFFTVLEVTLDWSIKVLEDNNVIYSAGEVRETQLDRIERKIDKLHVPDK